MSSTPIARQIDPQASFSTLTISPMPLGLPDQLAALEGKDTSGQQRKANDSLLSQVLTAQSQSSSQVQRLRLWRHDALVQHQYETAAFVADKVWHMTGRDQLGIDKLYFVLTVLQAIPTMPSGSPRHTSTPVTSLARRAYCSGPSCYRQASPVAI